MKVLFYIKNILLLSFVILFCTSIVKSDDWTITALDNPAPGYLRFDWGLSTEFFLVDNYGKKQFLVTYNLPAKKLNYKFLKNGLWIADSANKYYLYNQNMQIVDSIPCPPKYQLDFHDADVLSNGHYLLLCLESVPYDMSPYGGKKDAQLQSCVLVETDRNGTIYMEWHAISWNFDPTNISPDIDLTQPNIDFTHANTVTENNQGDFILSLRNLDEIIKISHLNGQVMWEMGGSKCKNNEFTFINDTLNGFTGFSHQHSVSVLPNGNLLMYDNGNLKTPQFSRAVEYKIDEVNMTVTKVWEYRDNPDHFQIDMGSVSRCQNGNTLINWGSSKITELKPDKSIAFELRYTNSNLIYSANRVITRMNAVSNSINDIGDYDFNDSNFTTGVTITVSSLTGSGLTSIEKHNYPPPTGEYRDSNFSFIYPFRWVFSQNGISNITGTIKFNVNTIQNFNKPDKAAIYKRDKETKGTFTELSTVYDSVSGEIRANFTGFGEFTIGSKAITSVANNNEINNQQLYLYPNPASVQIQFKDKNFTGEKYSLYNIEGTIIKEGIIDYDKIYINELCPGSYFVKVGIGVINFIKK